MVPPAWLGGAPTDTEPPSEATSTENESQQTTMIDVEAKLVSGFRGLFAVFIAELLHRCSLVCKITVNQNCWGY